MNSHVIARINPAAFQHNLQVVKQAAPKSQILAMIKANAYGHGLIRTAQALSAADAFGVARLEEAELLRKQGISHPIVVMAGFANAEELKYMAELNVATLVFNTEQIALLESQTLRQALEVWIKVDTGMHRLGFAVTELEQAYQRLKRCINVQSTLHFLSHFSCADQPEKPVTKTQMELFQQSVIWPGTKSLANSAPILTLPESHLDWVRPGIMLYGISPFSEQTGLDWNLQPVMTLSTVLIDIKRVKQGEAIGYGQLWTCPKDMTIGIAAIGYGDGFPRSAQNGTPVLVDGKLCGLVGRVSMDLISIDLGNSPQAKIGDPVVVWGEGLPIEKIAKAAGTIGYELTCRLTSRVVFTH